MSGALLFFISFRVFLTSDVMIGGTFDVSGLVFFCVTGVGLGVYNCKVLSKSMCRSSFHFCLCFIFFIFNFTYIFLWSSFVYKCFGPLHFKV